MQVATADQPPVVAPSPPNRRDVAHRHIANLARPWHEAVLPGSGVAEQAIASDRFATACVESIDRHANCSVSVFNAHTQEVCAWLRSRPNTEMLSTPDKLLNFAVSWIVVLARDLDKTTPSGAAPETSKTALDGVDLSLERIFFCVIGKRLEVKGSKCPVAACGNPKMLLVNVSMRSGDEGMATIYLCADCGTLVKKIKT
jgi:hypothetical protein